MKMRAAALLVRAQMRGRHIDNQSPPSCGGDKPTAERTMDPARTDYQSLTTTPGIREQPRPNSAPAELY